jgi:steroid 5-alpha reductase family enzyme
MIPVAIAQHNGGTITPLIISVLVWAFGLFIEAIADFQKFTFKRLSDSKNQWIKDGLWKYSRHPNYFGEILVWIAIYMYSFNALSGWQKLVCLASPLLITILLVFISGIPILEKSADKRWGKLPEYKVYKAKTPLLILFPFPKKS